MSIRLSIILFCILAVTAQSQTYNVKTQSVSISNFAADSLRVSPSFTVSDFENIEVVVASPHADSSVFYYAWQRGYTDGSGRTVWRRPSMQIDTFNTLVGSNFYASGSSFVGSDSDVVHSLDTIGMLGSVMQTTHIVPIWSPIARIWAKGLTGNDKTNYSLWFTINQRKYVRVDVGTGRQPE